MFLKYASRSKSKPPESHLCPQKVIIRPQKVIISPQKVHTRSRHYIPWFRTSTIMISQSVLITWKLIFANLPSAPKNHWLSTNSAWICKKTKHWQVSNQSHCYLQKSPLWTLSKPYLNTICTPYLPNMYLSTDYRRMNSSMLQQNAKWLWDWYWKD